MPEDTVWQVRLLTFNCYGLFYIPNTLARFATLARVLNRSSLDLVCLQEVMQPRYLTLLRRFMPSFPHVAYRPFGLVNKGGLITFSRWPLNDTGFTTYRQRGWWHNISLADWLLHKGFLTTALTVRGRPLVVYNTHLLANYSEDWASDNPYTRALRSELAQLAAAVQEEPHDRLVIAAGDFNVPLGSRLYLDFLRESGLSESGLLAGQTIRKRNHPPIDHILFRPPDSVACHATAWTVFDQRTRLVNGRADFLSDHIGIAARLTAASIS